MIFMKEKKEVDMEAEQNNDDFSDGRKLAYYEVADITKTRLEVLNICIDKQKQELL